jgi:hypothetical protein
MSDRTCFPWYAEPAAHAPHADRSRGWIEVDQDTDGLPVLRVIVSGDDHYSGTIDHKTLFRLLTAIAEAAQDREL